MALQGPIAHYHLIKCTALSEAIAHCHFKKQVDSKCVRTFGIRKIHRGNRKKSRDRKQAGKSGEQRDGSKRVKADQKIGIKKQISKKQ